MRQHSHNKHDHCRNSSEFDYHLTLKPDGSIEVKNHCGKHCTHHEGTEHPPIKRVVNTRTITIIEATGSQWVYINPPGRWYRVGPE